MSGADADPKLSMLRTAMAEAGVDALIVPSGDPHLSEYVHPHYNRREFISGFTGSAGTVLVTQAEALLWTDGRYFLQAEEELGAEWKLMRALQPGVPSVEDWLAAELPEGGVVGIDPMVHSIEDAQKIASTIGTGRTLKSLGSNLVDHVWEGAAEFAPAAVRPSKPSGEARSMPLKYTGVDRATKIKELWAVAASANADGVLVCALDEVAWLLNVRGCDVPHCPLLQSHVLVYPPPASGGAPRCVLFADEEKFSTELREELAASAVEIAPYDSILSATEEFAQLGKKLMMDPKSVNYGLRTAAGEGALMKPSSISMPKACKNEEELEGMLQAHLVDGAALANFFAWLERTVRVDGRSVTEVDIATKIAECRAAQPGFMDLSFPTIAGVGANGAIIHYNPLQAEEPATLDGSQLVLVDSGGQYECGTTDVTRTFHLGTPTQWQRECFTRVLKGNIGLDSAVFPQGTPGPALDAFARMALWQAGLDYMHGTGHGVGAGLNVHEGPMSISTRYQNTVGLKEGMVVSNEPGYYEPNAFGIRIENLLVARKKEVAGVGGKPFNDKIFLGFEQLTHVPIQKSLIETSLLTPAEIEWLDGYHSRVWERISPLLPTDSDAHKWLFEATRPLLIEEAAPVA